jgi:hypothetical protein
MLSRVCLAALLIAFASAACAEADAALIQKLRQGGYVLYLRHASTDFSQNDSRMKSYEDCSTQRNLTDKGREEARALGTHIKRLGIPIGITYASPFCRTMETARLAFGEPKPTSEVRGGPSRPDDSTRYDPLRKLLAAPPPRGRNNAISSHGNPFYALFGPPYLAEGEMAIVDPSTTKIVGRMRLEDWASAQK